MFQSNLVGIDTAKASFAVFEWKGPKSSVSRSVVRDKIPEYFQKMEKKILVMEACGGSHHWSRKFQAMGHEVKLIAPHKVIPFRKANKNDRNDAMAIALAASCPTMEFVKTKEIWQQDLQSIHRIRERLVHNQTSLVNEIRGLLLEYGVTIPMGITHVRSRLPGILNSDNDELSPLIRRLLVDLQDELLSTMKRIEKCDKELDSFFKQSEACQRIAKIEGIGVITATAICASCPDPALFKNGRQFAAWLGLVPGHTQTGGKDSKPIMLGITKKGDKYLRKLLVQGSMSMIGNLRHYLNNNQGSKNECQEQISSVKMNTSKRSPEEPCRKRKKLSVGKKPKSEPKLEWLKRLVEEKGAQKAAVAMANRNARVIWALLKSKQDYDPKRKGENAIDTPKNCKV